jgi:hypothetical protein
MSDGTRVLVLGEHVDENREAVLEKDIKSIETALQYT